MSDDYLQFWEDIDWCLLFIRSGRYTIGFDTNEWSNIPTISKNVITCSMAYDHMNKKDCVLVLPNYICFTCSDILYVINRTIRTPPSVKKYRHPKFKEIGELTKSNYGYDYIAAIQLRYICQRMERYYRII